MNTTLKNYYSTSVNRQAGPLGREETGPPCVADMALESPLGWDSKAVRAAVAEEYVNWVSSAANWTTFLTLTFRDETPPDVAKSLFKWFVQMNNKHLLGKNYTRKVGHSYFSYLLGMEYQRREVVHFHVLVDKPLDFSYVHTIWGARCGFAWIDQGLKDKEKVISYVCKYVLKGGDIDLFVAKRKVYLQVLPDWYKIVKGSSGAHGVALGVASLDNKGF